MLSLCVLSFLVLTSAESPWCCSEVWNNFDAGNNYLAEEHLKEAEHAYTTALALLSFDGRVRCGEIEEVCRFAHQIQNNLGTTYELMGDGVLAEKHYESAVSFEERLGAASVTSLLNAGRLQVALSRPGRGEHLFEAVLKLTTDASLGIWFATATPEGLRSADQELAEFKSTRGRLECMLSLRVRPDVPCATGDFGEAALEVLTHLVHTSSASTCISPQRFSSWSPLFSVHYMFLSVHGTFYLQQLVASIYARFCPSITDTFVPAPRCLIFSLPRLAVVPKRDKIKIGFLSKYLYRGHSLAKHIGGLILLR